MDEPILTLSDNLESSENFPQKVLIYTLAAI